MIQTARFALAAVAALTFAVAVAPGCAPRSPASPTSDSRAGAAAANEVQSGAPSDPSTSRSEMKPMTVRETPEQLRARLTRMQYEVTQNAATEPPFKNEYWNNHEAGLYVDIVSGEPLFTSLDKFDSGCGWPSFTKAIAESSIERKSDTTWGMTRTEVRTKNSDSHLGHVFDDGPGPIGERWCINSASLRFIPLADLEKEGYGAQLALFGKQASAKSGADSKGGAQKDATPATSTKEIAVLAGGCFWGMEDILRKLPGVLETEVGYTGGNVKNATYRNHEGHAEAIRITFDPAQLTYGALLDMFFKMHDPTTKNRQGNDVGTSYRSAIFYTSDAQKAEAAAAIERATKSGRWKKPIVTEVTAASEWWPAEEYHQDYLVKNPGGYTCHFVRD